MIFYARDLKTKCLIGNIAISFLTGLCFVFGGIAVDQITISVYLGFFAFLMTMAREIVKDMDCLLYTSREILEEVQRKILKKYLPSSKKVELVKSRLDSWKKDEKLDKKINYNDKLGDINLAIYVDSVRSFKAALELGCKKIYFQPKIEYMGRDESDDNFRCV